MFKVVVDRRKRRVWSARTVAASVGAHLLVLAGIVAAATTTEAAPTPDVVEIWSAPDRPKEPEQAKPTPPPPVDKPVPVKGRTLELQTPETVPDHVEPPKADDTPVSAKEYTGEGPVGNVIGEPPATPTPPAPDPAPLPDYRNDVIDAGSADVLPQLASPREAQRALERAYPSILRDAGVTGHTTVLLVIDKNGQVQPGSVTVQETTHDQFREAAIRAAERFRFRPARLNGQPVAVSITIPIEWQIAP